MKIKNSNLKYLIFQILITGMFIPLVKYVYNSGVDPLNFSCQILFAAFIILSAYSMSAEKGASFRIKKKHLSYLLAIGLVNGGLAYAFFSTGLKISSVVNCIFLMQAGVFFVPVLSYFFLKEHLKLYKIMLISILIVGVFFVTTSGEMAIPGTGDILLLLSALSFSIGTILSKIILEEVSIITFSLFRTLFGSISILIYLAVTDGINPDINIFWVFGSGLMIVLGTLALSRVLRETSASYVSMMSMSTPVVTLVFAYAFLGEEMTTAQLVGGVIVVFSGFLVHTADV
jgi:drug/metabolite transporter (DMT)-like permease